MKGSTRIQTCRTKVKFSSWIRVKNGGGTNSMLELLKRINRDKFDITCCFYSDYSRAEGETIGQVLNGIGIPLIVILNVRSRSGPNC